MDAQIQQQNSINEFAEGIKANLNEPQHRFEFHDPSTETTYRFHTANEATAKVAEFGAIRFQAINANGKVAQIHNIDGVWKRDDGMTLADIQASIDMASLSAINAREDERAAIENGIDAATDQQMALADAYAFRRIQNRSWQKNALVSLENNSNEYPDYMIGLEKALPGHFDTAETVHIANADDTAGLTAKDAPTTVEVPREIQDAAIDAAVVATAESAAPAASADEATHTVPFDQLSMEAVAAVRARDFAQARETLRFNTVEPYFDNEKQQRGSDNDVNRSDAQETAERVRIVQPVARESVATGNKVESGEIFTASQVDVKLVVPSDIESKYLHVGDTFYHPKNTDLVAFEDKGNKLETRSNSEAIAESMVRIAEARGWDEIKVSGSETFRREAWLEAASRGMHVKGYSPSEKDIAELAQRSSTIKANTVENDHKPFRARENINANEQSGATTGGAPAQQSASDAHNASVPPALIVSANAELQRYDDKGSKDLTGVVVMHGAAKYLHNEKNTGSYYVTTRDDNGTEKTFWGVDLKRAMVESGAKLGDKITLANEGQKLVTVTVPIRDESGKVIGQSLKNAQRSSWNIQMAETFAKESATEAVKKHPELAGAAAAVAVMDKQAEADGLTPAQRAIVAARVRQNVINSIERGALPQVTLKHDMEVTREVSSDKEYTR